jgi:hypothetical protein
VFDKYRQFKIVCKDRAEYSACIRDAGEQMKSDLRQNCGAKYKDCFESKNIDLSREAATCLALTLFGCGPGIVACAETCNLGFATAEWAAFHSCSADVSPCYESALNSDKERQEHCKE